MSETSSVSSGAQQTTGTPSDLPVVEMHKPLTSEEKEDIRKCFTVLNHFANGDYSSALSVITEIRTERMREEMQQLTEFAQEFGPLESAADNLIHRLFSVSKEGEKIELNSHMREFLNRALKMHPPKSDTTARTIEKLLNSEKLSEVEAKDLHAYLDEAKLTVIPQGKRSSLLTEQIKGLQNRFEQEVSKAGESISAYYPR